jgi:hypothetical protein
MNITVRRTIILVLVLYGFQALSLTFRKENILRVLENSVLRKILRVFENSVLRKILRVFENSVLRKILRVLENSVLRKILRALENSVLRKILRVFENSVLRKILRVFENSVLRKILRVFENSVLRKIHGPTREEVTGYWWRLYNEELHDLCLSLNILSVITSRKIKWKGHVARMGGEEKSIQSVGGDT